MWPPSQRYPWSIALHGPYFNLNAAFLISDTPRWRSPKVSLGEEVELSNRLSDGTTASPPSLGKTVGYVFQIIENIP